MNVIPNKPRNKVSRRQAITAGIAALVAVPIIPMAAEHDGHLLSLWNRAKEIQTQAGRWSEQSKRANDVPERRALELNRQSWQIEDQIAEATPVGPKDRLAQSKILAMEIDIAGGSVHENAGKVVANLTRYFGRAGGVS